MANLARTYEEAPRGPTVTPTLAALYWAVVEDCLVQFHGLSRDAAVSCVMGYLRRLASALATLPWNAADSAERHKYDDIIYHEEPWNSACDLAQHQPPFESNKAAYHEILRRHHLM
jgi:hypothetical protein